MCLVDVQERQTVAASSAIGELVFTLCLGLCLIINTPASSAGQQDRSESRQAIHFDIPAQPLAQALDVYTRATGMATLVDQQLVTGRQSSAVKGVLTPHQALQILLAGTNLSTRYTSSDAFTLQPSDGTAGLRSATGVSAAVPAETRQAYFAALQGTLTRLLCRKAETQPGLYRLGLQLWIGANGTILASHFLESTGDRQRDAVITDLLASAAVATPPAELPQPITVVLLPNGEQQLAACRQNGRSSG